MRIAFIDTDIIDEFVSLSQKIAKLNGHADLENGLQKLPVLEEKYNAEVRELRESLTKERVWQLSEAGDCLKYAACIDFQSGSRNYVRYTDTLALLASAIHRISQHDAEVAGLAKYRLRAASVNRKQQETPEARQERENAENAAIMAAIQASENWPGWTLPEVAEQEDIPLATLYYACRKEHRLIPSREAGKTVLINKNDYLWYAWLAKYRRRALA